jgi:DNA-binding IclR family transcriptional regulator
MLHKPPQTVGALAAAVGESASLCSQHLKHLQARGLCRADRHGRFVQYELMSDPLVPSAAPMLAALREAVDGQDRQIMETFRQLTAYTHPRRIALVAELSRRGRLTPAELHAHCAMSECAVYRHLDKLGRRGVVRWEDDHVRLGHPTTPFGQALLALAIGRSS